MNKILIFLFCILYLIQQNFVKLSIILSLFCLFCYTIYKIFTVF